jgi:hypothetical protein
VNAATAVARRHAGALAMCIMASACGSAPGLSGATIAALGARDGYVFVVSPFNCFLTADQIGVLNAIAARTRRSGVILTAGAAAGTDSTAARAVADLGIRMRASRLLGTPIDRGLNSLGWKPPVIIAMRHGEVVAILRGEQAREFDTWIAWLEGQSLKPAPGAYQ